MDTDPKDHAPGIAARGPWTHDRLRALVHPDRVHRSLYVDPQLFDLEMERVFGTAWVFVGHESMVPEPHDFIATRIGREPVLMTRDGNGKIHVIFNRCAHRGVEVCPLDRGNARLFRCAYHGWSYRSDGALAGIPLRKAYPADIEPGDPRYSMRAVPRVDAYRGFVFASLSAEGPTLDRYLNGIRKSIDDLADRAPEGTVSFKAGVSRYVIEANWKLQIDNAVDLPHASFTHVSTVDENGRQFGRYGGGPRLLNDDGRMIDWDALGVVGFEYGHGYQGRPPAETVMEGPLVREYRLMLEKKHGVKRTEEILAYDRFNSVVYPSLTFQAFGQHIRVVRPISVDRTEINIWPIWLDGAPEELNRRAIRSLSATHSAASMIQTDDVEVFERAQRALSTTANDWVLFQGWMGSEERWHDGWRGPGASEFVSRNQYARNWISYMCGGYGNE